MLCLHTFELQGFTLYSSKPLNTSKNSATHSFEKNYSWKFNSSMNKLNSDSCRSLIMQKHKIKGIYTCIQCIGGMRDFSVSQLVVLRDFSAKQKIFLAVSAYKRLESKILNKFIYICIYIYVYISYFRAVIRAWSSLSLHMQSFLHF